LWHAFVNYKQKVSDTTLNWFAKVDNLSNQWAYSATSILTTTAPGKSPLPGRSLKLGVVAAF
jgi:iron complex outermembrane receptor protein